MTLHTPGCIVEEQTCDQSNTSGDRWPRDARKMVAGCYCQVVLSKVEKQAVVRTRSRSTKGGVRMSTYRTLPLVHVDKRQSPPSQLFVLCVTRVVVTVPICNAPRLRRHDSVAALGGCQYKSRVRSPESLLQSDQCMQTPGPNRRTGSSCTAAQNPVSDDPLCDLRPK